MKDIILIGGGGHALSVADTIERTGQYNIIGYTDVCDSQCRYKYLGTDDVLMDYYHNGVQSLAMGIGFLGCMSVEPIPLRSRLYEKFIAMGFSFPAIIDPSAVVSEHTTIGDGTFVGKGAIINAEVKLGTLCIVNSGAILDHECEIGSGTHVATGATLCGQVKVGENTLIGAGATILQCKNIGERVIVGAGSTVLRDIVSGEKAYSIVK